MLCFCVCILGALDAFSCFSIFSSNVAFLVCRVSKFSNISHLVMMFPSNFGGDYTQISYIGLKGDVMGARRQAVIAVYESKPMGHTLKDALAQKAGLGM